MEVGHATILDMDTNVTALERAFALARSGQYATVTDIRKQLNAEGYDGNQVYGLSLTKQLNYLISEAHAKQLP